MTEDVCAIWGTPATRILGYERRDGDALDSPRAGGRYFISGTAKVNSRNLSEGQKVALTHEIVDNSALDSVATITSYTIDALPQDPKFSPQSRAMRLLRYLISRSQYLGEPIEFPTESWTHNSPNLSAFGFKTGFAAAPLFAWSDSIREEEVRFLLEMLVDQKLIKPLKSESLINEITVLPAGYSRFEEDYATNNSEQAFVAMWFNESMRGPYENGVEAAVRECGFRPLRIDRKEHNNRIDDEILAEIKKSRFLIADFTSEPDKPRGGVYFEAGFALGLGISVIWTCKSDVFDKIHFDTRQFNHIVWNNDAELKVGLVNRIQATIGIGPLKIGQ
jgi:hypothetical protein